MVKKTPEVKLQDPMAEAGRKLLVRQIARMKRHEAGSRTGEDIESVHQMRVAIRRMRSLFQLLDSFYKRKTIAKYAGGLRQIARALGKIRDIDVLILDLEAFKPLLPVETQPTLDSIIDILEKRRSCHRDDLNQFFDSKRYRRFVRQFRRLCKRTGRGAIPVKALESPHQARHVLPILLHERLARVRAYATVLPAADDAILHALRVEFKQLRYAIEFFEPLLGTSASRFLVDAKAMQESLGRIHDIAVFCDYIKRIKCLTPQQSQAAELYVARREAELAQLRDEFMLQWTDFNTRRRQRHFSDALLTLR